MSLHSPPQSQLVVVENRQTVLDPKQLFDLVWALDYFARYHYGRSAWVIDAHAPRARVRALTPGAKPPGGAWNLILLDTSDQAGALGYHDDETGTGIPYSDVFVITSINDGADPAAVAAHELVEMLVDPDVAGVNGPKVAPGPNARQYILEPGDPVQGNDYDVGEPEGRPTGVKVCDFALPAWWGLAQSGPQHMSYRQSVGAPFQIAPQGYISWCPRGANPGDPNVWQQSFGAKQRALPPWASRLPRVHPVTDRG